MEDVKRKIRFLALSACITLLYYQHVAEVPNCHSQLRHGSENQFGTAMGIWYGSHTCTSVPDYNWHAELVVRHSHSRVSV